MKRILLAAMALLCLGAATAGCSPTTPVPGSPQAAAEQTVLDEKALLGAELAYKAMRTAGSIAIEAGLLEGERADQVAEIDTRAFEALRVARQAYRAGNAADYTVAIGEVLALIGQAQALFGPAPASAEGALPVSP